MAAITSLRFIFHLLVSWHTINCQNITGLKEKVTLGYIWENPRIEEHNAEEVVIDGKTRDLRLICILQPPLPVTSENFLARDKIVKWTKVKQTHAHQLMDTFWSDDQTITAISMSHLRLRQLGIYGCSYRGFLKIINITVNNVENLAMLPKPSLHSDLEGVVMNIKNMVGLKKWYSFPRERNDNLGLDFQCSLPKDKSTPVPTSVHRLRPSDVDIIMSIGGAMSAGVAANASSVPELFSSHKTVSFSIGGKHTIDKMVTLPSILKKFNPNLKGAVIREESFTTMHYGTSLRYLPSRVTGLVEKLEKRKDIDFNLNWKLLTLSLDFDDYCFACRIRNQWDERIRAIVEALDILYLKVPRIYISLLLPPNITQLYTMSTNRQCPKLYWKRCECLESGSAEERSDVMAMLNDLKSHLTKVVKKYNSRSDFAVVIQPFWSDIRQGKSNLLAKDCFHLSLSGHEYAAVNLWNNLLQPIFQKNNHWIYDKSILCPTENEPYLFTTMNSPKDSAIDLSINSDTLHESSRKPSSSSSRKIALGIGLTLFFILAIVVVMAIIFFRKNKQISMRSKIRILATPWKRMKEKI